MQHDDAGEFFADTQADGSGAGAPSALPGTHVRPLTRRRHVRVPGATAAALERLAWSGTEEPVDIVTAVSVVPSLKRSRRVTRPASAGADLAALLGDEELGCRPGRHRENQIAWQLLHRVPGWRPSTPAGDADADADADASTQPSIENTADDGSVAEHGAVRLPNTHQNTDHAVVVRSNDGAYDPDATDELPVVPAAPAPDIVLDIVHDIDLVPVQDGDPMPVDLPFEPPAVRDTVLPPVPQQPAAPAVETHRPAHAEPPAQAAPETPAQAEPQTALEAEIAAAADVPVPAQREASGPWYRQRRRRSPAPSLRAELQAAGALLQRAQDQPEIARIAAEQAAGLVDADIAALVLRAVEGPRVLWLHPGGPDAAGLWGPATLNALLAVGQPVSRVVEGDPLAGGAATALLAVPVPSGGAIAGTLIARRHEPRAFSANEQDVLARLARMAGAAMLSALRRIAFERGELDDLTGLPGGLRLSGDVAAAVRTAERAGMPVTVLATHVLGLARLRTELGSPAADQVLRELARAFAAVLRVGDVAYRIGEDEFALLLPATDGAGVPAIRERLEAVTTEVVAGLGLPGSPRQLALRTAEVPLDVVRVGGDVVDAVNHALELDRQRVRWAKAAPSSR